MTVQPNADAQRGTPTQGPPGEAASVEPTSSRAERRSWPRRVATAFAGGVGIAAAAAAVLVLPDLLPVSPAARASEQSIGVEPAEITWVCPGPARLTDPASVGDAQFAPSPVGTVSAAGALVVTRTGTQGRFTALDGSAQTPLTESSDALAATVEGPASGSALVVAPSARDAGMVELGAGTSSITTEGDLRGLVAARCAAPSAGSWLVGGSTEVGSRTQLIMQNPGPTPAKVRVRVWGPGGPVALGSGTTRIVPARSEIMVPVEAVAPDQPSLVVHVAATGGMIGAYLQHNTVDGLVALGVDDVVAGGEPSRRLALSGVVTSGVGVDDPHAPRLRLLSPDGSATARVLVLGAKGPVRLRGAEEVSLSAGVVTDVSLGGIPAGTYGVAIEADSEVVAGAVTDRQGAGDPDLVHAQAQFDRAWIAAESVADVTDGTALGGVALVPGSQSTIVLAGVPTTRLDVTTETDPVGEFAGVLTAFNAGGERLGSVDVTVSAGAVTSVAAAEIAPDAEQPVAFVTMRAVGDSSVAPVWSVWAEAGPSDGPDATVPSLISVISPTRAVDVGSTVTLRAVDTAR